MFTPTQEQQELRLGIERRADDLSADAIRDDRLGEFSWERWKLIRDSGLLGLLVAERWGGLGSDLLTAMYVLEGLGMACRDGGASFSAVTSICSTMVPLQEFAQPALADRYLPRLATGELIGAHAITEADHGSDALQMAGTAVREDDCWVLNGSKLFVTNGPIADLVVVYLRTRPEGGPLGTSAFLVDTSLPGVHRGPSEAKLGLRTSPLGELHLDGVRVPADHLIGRRGLGFAVLDHVMKREILLSFVVNTGEMSHRLQRCLDYARARVQFGRPIAGFQLVSKKLVDAQIGLRTARMWLYEAAELLLAGHSATEEIAIAKLVTSEANVAAGLAAVQTFGGYGYLSEYGVEADLRAAVGSTIYSGTNDIQYTRIAAAMGL
jgi:alkylation response protein AidB-like acyl-CoA dehydrogenase